jgi:hypothetical protein
MRRIFLASFVVLGACGVDKVGDEGGGACVPDPVQMVFDTRCATPACHDAATRQQGLSLAAGDSADIIGKQAVQKPLPLVEIGNPEGSYLALKMMAMPAMPITGTRMPQAANFDDPVLQTDVSVIVGWIGGAEFSACAGGSGSDTAGSTSMTTAATTESGSTGGSNDPLLCGLGDLAPGVASPVVAGDAAGQIPTEIGFIIDHNCGCHLTDATPFVRPVADSADANPPHMTTLADWQGMSSPTSMLTTLEDVRSRLDPMIPLLIMPPPGSDANPTCDIGTGETMPPDERARLLQWIDAGGPDGASWPP